MTFARAPLLFLAAASACGGDDVTRPPDPVPAVALAFADISDLSPDLAEAPFRGNPGWDTSDKYSPGVALADLDGDGFLDLIQPRNDARSAEHSTPRLYRGLGDGTFENVTPIEWEVRRPMPAALTADFDGDGDLDVFLGVDGQSSVLYRNEGDFLFTDVSSEAGLGAFQDRVFVASAGDLDNDGDVDLYTGAWNASAPEHGPGTAPNRILLNDGAGVFTELFGEAQCEGRATLASTLVDLDRDGDLDIYVGNDFFDDCLYRNNGDGTFTDVAPALGTDKSAASAMGVTAGDLDGDGFLDLIVTDGVKPDDQKGNAVFLGQGGMNFELGSAELGLDLFEGLAGPEIMFGWGAGIYDFDLDGDNDVHVVTHITVEELFWQRTEGAFVLARNLTFGALPDQDGRGSAYGDLDGDLDIDIVVARRGDGAYVADPTALQILRNDTPTSHRAVAIDIRPYHRAPGAIVTITTDDGRTQVQPIQTGNSYASSSPPTAIFGLGEATGVTRLEVDAIGLAPVVILNPPTGRFTVDVVAGTVAP